MRGTSTTTTFVVLALGLVSLVGLLPLTAGCDEDYKTCYPGDYLGCTCANGQPGYASCSPAGDFASAQCVCDGTTPGVDAASSAVIDAAPEATGSEAGDDTSCRADASAADAAAPLKKYFETCTTHVECETCRCEMFGGQGRCTKACTTLDQCPPPADACTNRGVCRPPT